MKNLLYLTIIAVLLLIGRLVLVATDTVAILPAQIDLEVDKTVTALDKVDGQLLETQGIVDKQLTGLRGDLLTVSANLTADADKQLTVTNDTISANLASITADIHRTSDATTAVLDNTAKLSAQLNDAAPLWLDCEFNPDCAFNRYQGTAKALEKMAINVGEASKQFPAVVETAQETNKSVAGITADVHTMTQKFVAPLTFKQKVMAFIKFSAGVAGRIY